MASPLYLTLLAGPVIAVPVPKPLIDALVSAEVTESATGRSGFQLTFTLADDSILQTFFVLAASSPVPVLRVVLMATFGGLPQVVIDGIVMHCEVSPEAMQGSSKLVVTGEDLSALMGFVDFTGLPYPGTSPDVRVAAILAKYAAFGVVPAVTPVPVPDIEVPTDRTPGQKGTDLDYIQELARLCGYVFYMIPGPAPGTSAAYWGPQIRFGMPQPCLNVNLDAWTNVESLSLRYEPQGAVTPVVFTQVPVVNTVVPIPIPSVTPFNPPLGLMPPIPQKVEPLEDTAKLPIGQALMRGMARAVETADIITGQGSLDVQRYGQILRARSLVGMRGAGVAFDGIYYVDSTTHQVKPGEYKQSFVLKRNALIANTPVVPAMPF
ncbi:hypothetical protein [Paraburkholderia unamae]|jgi:hypothetical protein|uniref:Phage protein D n=1 Tax=Paraburkholderia unamae TaxID=219649 RepID=A0ABX5KR26_9BURK|nr:hypothetical protein [Paraburkholderia unamae]PVX85132.1 hypothetical protein C7402_104376 [Paraburkholderia unamae]RAR65778.1 hypothetical protein C7401_10384 [Paraburkholderia unamae]CAG9244901.1 conserved hypothetical protein [Paraburkholderia unamae]